MTGLRNPLTLSDATSDIYTAMLIPKGRANNIAKRLTQSVPASSGHIPKSGAGVAVGNHSEPANTSFGEIDLSSMKLRLAPSGIMDSGTNATIPGFASIRDVIRLPAFSYWLPISSSVK